MHSFLAGLAVTAALGLSAVAAIGPVRAEGSIIRELKIGGLYHDVGDLWSGFRLEPRSVDVNVEVLFGPHIELLWGKYIFKSFFLKVD